MSKELKSLIIADEIQSDVELSSAVERATELLIEELGDSSDSVDVVWRCRGNENGSRSVELSLADESGSILEHFAADELKVEDHLRRRLYWLWGKHLRGRMQRQLDRLHQVVQELEG